MHENEYLYMIHRDIKPENMVLNSDLQMKLCDFGFARRMLPIIFTIEPGYPVYMAPEVFIENEPYSAKCDNYSWALSFWRCFMEEKPFKDVCDRATLVAEKRKSDRPLENIPESSDFPSEMNQIIQKCYSHNPANRPDMREVVERLEKILNINQS